MRAAPKRPGIGIAEFDFDALAMGFHSGSADAEFFRDASHALFGGDETEYCQLAIAQDPDAAGKRLTKGEFWTASEVLAALR